MGTGWPKDGSPQPTFALGQLDCPEITQDPETLIQNALINNPGLTRMDKVVEIAEREKRIAGASIYPKINFFAGTNVRHDKDASDSGFMSNFLESAFGISGSPVLTGRDVSDQFAVQVVWSIGPHKHENY